MAIAGLGISLLSSIETQPGTRKAACPVSTTALDSSTFSEQSGTTEMPPGAPLQSASKADLTKPDVHAMTGDQVRNFLMSQGGMSLHAFAITQTFQPNSTGGVKSVSSGSEDWITKMQGILSFDRQHDNTDFVQQDAKMLNTLEVKADHRF